MTPERVSMIFRELLQTPDEQLDGFARRAGLRSQPERDDLRRCHHILLAVGQALEASNPADWAKVQAAFEGMQQLTQTPQGNSAAAGAAALAAQQAAPEKPEWIRDLPPMPSLGDPAPGTSEHAEMQKKHERFVPQAYAAAPPTTSTTSAAAPQAVSALSANAASGRHVPSAGRYAAEPSQAHYSDQPEPPPLMLEPEPEAAPPPAPRRPPPPPPRADPRGLPPVHVDPKYIPEMSVARYAALCAACANTPDRIPEILIEYGLANDNVRAALDAQWHDQFDDDPELLSQWEQLFAQFRGQLKA